MDRLARLVEELEARPLDADRVASVARWLAAVGDRTARSVGHWLVQGARPERPPRIPLARLREAAREASDRAGQARWQFDAGVDAADDLAEGIALLMPARDATLAGPAPAVWLADWVAAVRQARKQPGEDGAAATIDAVARLPDALARRWALRAAAGLARPPLTPWQWVRALAAARGWDRHDLGWHLHGTRSIWPEDGRRPPPGPRPSPWPVLHDEAPPRPMTPRSQARWPGWRVQLVAAGADPAVWHVDGELLNPRLPAAAWTALSALPPGLLDDGPLQALLLAWDASRGRALPREAPEETITSWHLVLLPRVGRDELRGGLPTWPRQDASDPAPPPLVFVNATTPHDDAGDRVALTRRGATGRVLHAGDFAWVQRPPPHRLRALVQYLPMDWWRGGATPDARSLAAGEAGLALWMPGAPDGVAPLARVPLSGLDEPTLRALHAAARERPGQRFGTVVQLAPWAVVEVEFDTTRPSRRHRVGAVVAGARLVAWRPGDDPATAASAADLLALVDT